MDDTRMDLEAVDTGHDDAAGNELADSGVHYPEISVKGDNTSGWSVKSDNPSGGSGGSRSNPESVKYRDTDSDPENEPDDDEDEGPIRKGCHVKCVRGQYKGMCGKVKSVHRSGLVPDVDDDVMGTKDDPAVRLQCYKAMREGYVETEHHVAVKAAHCERIEDLKPPKRGKSFLPPARERALDIEILPGEIRTDEDIRAERATATLAAARSPDAMKALATAIVEQMQGVV